MNNETVEALAKFTWEELWEQETTWENAEQKLREATLTEVNALMHRLEQTPEMKALRELQSFVVARDAQCLELLKTLGHEEGCSSIVTSKSWPHFYRSFPTEVECNCAHADLAALLGRAVG